MATRTRRHKLALTLSAFALAAAGAIGAVGAPAAPAEAAGRCVDYTYSQGGYSSCIGYIQQLVNYHSGAGLVVDNAFGPKTKSAVMQVQWRFGLTVDGIVGPRTWNIICYPQKGPGPIPGFPYTAARAAGCSI
ncbi:peptidoglycan-binding domain-containing protein [Agromyces soli]